MFSCGNQNIRDAIKMWLAAIELLVNKHKCTCLPAHCYDIYIYIYIILLFYDDIRLANLFLI